MLPGFKFSHQKPSIIVMTDASIEAWGAHCSVLLVQGRQKPTRINTSYPQTGTRSSVDCFKGCSPLHDMCSDSDGQHIYPTLHQQIRRNQIGPALSDNMGNATVVFAEQD